MSNLPTFVSFSNQVKVSEDKETTNSGKQTQNRSLRLTPQLSRLKGPEYLIPYRNIRFSRSGDSQAPSGSVEELHLSSRESNSAL
jgi:hypothetical protein